MVSPFKKRASHGSEIHIGGKNFQKPGKKAHQYFADYLDFTTFAVLNFLCHGKSLSGNR